jgi:hypothetical protein
MRGIRQQTRLLLPGATAGIMTILSDGSSRNRFSYGRGENRANGAVFIVSKAQVVPQKKLIKKPFKESRSISTDLQKVQWQFFTNAVIDSITVVTVNLPIRIVSFAGGHT